MPNIDSYIVMGMGGIFAFLALVTFLWARGEEKSINNALLRRRDLREFFTRWPERIEPGALRVGGWILLSVGVVLIIIGGVLLL
ncbi:MAG: hypothetical protein IBX36_02160 [Dehalococcoidia bacterium]|nr:hypothetical protein [Dehalococcoidia bacterium]